MSSCFTISLSLLFFFINFLGTESAPTYLWKYCNSTLYSTNSTYQSNLKNLLSSLSAAAAAPNNTGGFANTTAGQNSPDRAYGIFLCRGDVSASVCSDCVATGTQDILQRCPNQRVSTIWYDECMLRYSNQPILSVMERDPYFTLYNTGNVTDSTQFMDVLLETMGGVITRASAGGSGKKVAAAQANFTSLQTLYALAQCTPDLTEWDCNTCLQFANGYLVQGKQGGRVLTPSCYVRYEFYPFYNVSALPAPVPAPLPPPPMTGPKGKTSKSTMMAIAISVPIGGVLVLLFLTCCLLRGRKTDEIIQGNSGANELTTVESLRFDLATIQAATNDFSPENKLGEGGFGEVFQIPRNVVN